jgi:putative flippase GtrA
VLHKHHVNPLEAKAISTAVATVVTYLGSRFWTFKHRENQALGREAVLFIVLNVVGLLIAEAVIAIVTYVFGLRSGIEYNAASVIGTGLATIFRYFAYRQWVFTAPAAESAFGSATAPETQPFPDYPPWELDPAYLAAAAASGAAPGVSPTSGTAETQAFSPWEPDAEQRQPWMENQVTLPMDRGGEPLLAGTGPQEIGQIDPLAGPRSQGRHRRP